MPLPSWLSSVLRPAAPAAAAPEQKQGWNFTGGGASLSTSFASYSNDTGMAVSPSSSLGSAAVYACVRILSEDVAKLPLQIRRASHAQGRTSWVEEARHPLMRVLRRPNAWMTTFDLVSTMVASLQLYGNSYTAIIRDASGAPRSLIPMIPSRTTVLVGEAGNLYYQTTHPLFGPEQRTFPAEDTIHVKNFCLDSPVGISPIAASQNTVGLSLATQRHAAKVYSQGTMLSGVLQHPGTLSPEAAVRLSQSWSSAYSGGDNAFKTALLEEGTTFQGMGMDMVSAQVIESRKFSVEEVARIFRVPLTKLGVTEGSSYASAEQTEQAYVGDALAGICRRIEEALNADLLFDDERDDLQFRFSFEELLRGDSETRMKVAQLALINGIKSQNEVRAEENLGPIPNGDVYRVPANVTDPLKPTDALKPMGGENEVASATKSHTGGQP